MSKLKKKAAVGVERDLNCDLKNGKALLNELLLIHKDGIIYCFREENEVNISDGDNYDIEFRFEEPMPAEYKNLTSNERYHEGRSLYELGNAVGVELFLVNDYLNTLAIKKMNLMGKK
uniref:Uma2 domain-containing protein n=1 Tax=Rhabditophanes sp. KR3021 TaxID=114890 RepID=A0AC35UFK2_9BILA